MVIITLGIRYDGTVEHLLHTRTTNQGCTVVSAFHTCADFDGENKSVSGEFSPVFVANRIR